jgi:hypothetical protein
MVIEPSVRDTFIKTLEANKEKIARARQDAHAGRNDASIHEQAAVLRTHNEAILAILQSMAAGEKP